MWISMGTVEKQKQNTHKKTPEKRVGGGGGPIILRQLL